MPTFTACLKGAAIVPEAILALSSVATAQNRADLRQHYGHAVGEVYRTSNHLTVTAYFDERGNICGEHIESENRGMRMTDKEVNTVLDEIAPRDERGKYKKGAALDVICLPDNDCRGSSEDYERLKITRIGTSNEYRYVSIVYHSAECRKLDADKKK